MGEGAQLFTDVAGLLLIIIPELIPGYADVLCYANKTGYITVITLSNVI